MPLHESGQMYLEAIYVLSQQRPVVRSIDVGEYLGYSKPSVSRAMSILKKNGYVIAEEDGALHLTPQGLDVAQTMYSRHTVLTKMLTAIGVAEAVAAEDACRIEHVISEETFAAIKQHMDWAEKK